jgi:hypothetical protein
MYWTLPQQELITQDHDTRRLMFLYRNQQVQFILGTVLQFSPEFRDRTVVQSGPNGF